MFQALCISVIIFLPGIVFSQTNNSADSSLSALRSLYDDGKYSNCEFEARRLLERRDLSDSIRILAEQHLAFALVAQEQHDGAVEHFTTILLLTPSFDLDPVLTSPKILTVFNEAKLKYLSRQKRAVAEPRPAASAPASGPAWRTLVFPGWEQLHQGRSTAGISFAAAGTATLTAIVYCDIQRRDKHNSYLAANTSSLAASRYDDYNGYYKTEMYSVFAFVAVYLTSQIDVILSPQDQFGVALQSETTSLSFQVRF
jgi:hypothetical protein